MHVECVHYVCGGVWCGASVYDFGGGEEDHDGKWHPDQTEGEETKLDQAKEFERDPGDNGEPREGLALWSDTVPSVLGRSLWVP